VCAAALGFEPRQRSHSPPLAAGNASELEIEFHPYDEGSPRLAAGRVQKTVFDSARLFPRFQNFGDPPFAISNKFSITTNDWFSPATKKSIIIKINIKAPWQIADSESN